MRCNYTGADSDGEFLGWYQDGQPIDTTGSEYYSVKITGKRAMLTMKLREYIRTMALKRRRKIVHPLQAKSIKMLKNGLFEQLSLIKNIQINVDLVESVVSKPSAFDYLLTKIIRLHF